MWGLERLQDIPRAFKNQSVLCRQGPQLSPPPFHQSLPQMVTSALGGAVTQTARPGQNHDNAFLRMSSPGGVGHHSVNPA